MIRELKKIELVRPLARGVITVRRDLINVQGDGSSRYLDIYADNQQLAWARICSPFQGAPDGGFTPEEIEHYTQALTDLFTITHGKEES